MFDNNFNYN